MTPALPMGGWRAWAGEGQGGRFVPTDGRPDSASELVYLGELFQFNGEDIDVFEERVPDGRAYYDYVPKLWARLKGE